jgi:hypothetical protein
MSPVPPRKTLDQLIAFKLFRLGGEGKYHVKGVIAFVRQIFILQDKDFF